MRKQSNKGSAKKKKSATLHRNLDTLARSVLSLYAQHPTHVWNYKQVAKQLDIIQLPLKLSLQRILEVLSHQELLIEVKPGAYRYNVEGDILEGIFERSIHGEYRIIPIDGSPDIIISGRNKLHALPGDRVRVRLFQHKGKGRPHAEVIDILQRAKSQYIGQISLCKDWALCKVKDRNLDSDIMIPLEMLQGAKQNDKVVVSITRWSPQDKIPLGKVIELLGKSGDHETEMRAILADHSIDYTYPVGALEEAGSLSGEISADELARREDFRQVQTITIDPETAKDFDDALSVRSLSEGKYEVGVHIADVSFFVPEGSLIDQEAYTRATSVYLVDRTIPMLPEILANGLCSLRPNEDHYTYSCVFVMDSQAHVESYRIVRSIIRSNLRLTYEQAQEVIDTGRGPGEEVILPLLSLSRLLRKKRFEEGAINFQSQEVRFILDSQGCPTDIIPVENSESHFLIEEFMLLANKTVAEHIGRIESKGKRSKNFVYRIHAQPSTEKLSTLAAFVGKFGYKLAVSGENQKISQSFNKLLCNVRGKNESTLIETLAIRAMSRAEYSPDNIGHYGLGFSYYTHFTSPIRRYPDLMVHRLLTRYAEGGRAVPYPKLVEMCKHCSEQEQTAALAERDSIKYKQVEYMKSRMGRVFDGVISGVTEWGLYVELQQTHCEGLIPIRLLDGDFFDFDEKNYRLRGRRTGRTYNLGDKITVRVTRADLEQRQLDFEIV